MTELTPNREAIAELIELLRNSEQAFGAVCRQSDNVLSYCAEGAIAQVYGNHHAMNWVMYDGYMILVPTDRLIEYDNNTISGYLPHYVYDWFGLNHNEVVRRVLECRDEGGAEDQSVVSLNDYRKISLNEFADVFETYLEGGN